MTLRGVLIKMNEDKYTVRVINERLGSRREFKSYEITAPVEIIQRLREIFVMMGNEFYRDEEQELDSEVMFYIRNYGKEI